MSQGILSILTIIVKHMFDFRYGRVAAETRTLHLPVNKRIHLYIDPNSRFNSGYIIDNVHELLIENYKCIN